MSTPISPNGPERPDAPWDNLDDPYWNPPAPRPPTLRSPSPEPLEPMSMPNSPAPVSPTVSGLRVDDYDFDPATLGPSVPPSPGQTSDLSEPYVWEGFDADPELPPATPGRITDEYINSTLGLDQFHANQTPVGPAWVRGRGLRVGASRRGLGRSDPRRVGMRGLIHTPGLLVGRAPLVVQAQGVANRISLVWAVSSL